MQCKLVMCAFRAQGRTRQISAKHSVIFLSSERFTSSSSHLWCCHQLLIHRLLTTCCNSETLAHSKFRLGSPNHALHYN